MVGTKPIRTEEEYEAEFDSPEGEELDILVDFVELYESKHVPIGYLDPIEAIKFRMEQMGLSWHDLVP